MGPFVFGHVALLGFFAFGTLHYFWQWCLSRRERMLLVFAGQCALSAVSAACFVALVTATTIRTAQIALAGRTTAGVLAVATSTWLVSRLTGVAARRYVTFIVGFTVIMGTVNLLVPRFPTVTEISRIDTWWGETLSIPPRQPGRPWQLLIGYLIVSSSYVFGVIAAARVWQRDRLAASLITLASVLSLLAAGAAVLVDIFRIPMPYLGIPGLAAWALVFAVLLSREYASRGVALAATEARYRTIIESAPEAIVVLDVEQGRFVDFNRNACALFEAGASAIRNLGPADLSPARQPDGRESASAANGYIMQAAAGAELDFEWMHRTLGGREIPCEVRLVRLPDPHRVLVRGSITNIIDRRQLEEQLRQSQKMDAIGQLAGGVAHDFNNLLTVMSGHSETLLTALAPGDPLSGHVRSIASAAERAASLTHRLLAFSRQAVLTPKVLNINAEVADAERLLRRLIGEDILLSTLLGHNIGNVRVDQSQLSQVLMNLAVNARDAMPRGGRLTIETGSVDLNGRFALDSGMSPGPYVRLSITDTGVGMTPETRAHVFEPFYTSKAVGKGTGLGLAMVHGIVKQSGGHIVVESELGVGTTFTIYLPAIDEPETQTEETPARPAVGGGETILLVEDEEGVRELGVEALRACGFTVLTARNGSEALQLVDARQGPIDLLVTDVVMPSVGGRDLADRLRARLPDLKVLFMSGYSPDRLVGRDASRAHEAFLQKPFALASLAQKVRELLDEPIFEEPS